VLLDVHPFRPVDFLDGTQSSTPRGAHTLSPAHSPRSPRPSLSAIPRALLERLSSFFHHSHSDVDGQTELRQCPRRSIFSRGPRIVEIATVRDRNVFPSPRPRPFPIALRLVQQFLSRLCMLLRDRGRSSKGSCMHRACHHNLSLPQPQPHLLKVLALPHQVQQPCSHHSSNCGLFLFCFSAAHLHRKPMAINSGAAYVQSFCFSRLPLLHRSCFLIVRLLEYIELDHTNRRESIIILRG